MPTYLVFDTSFKNRTLPARSNSRCLALPISLKHRPSTSMRSHGAFSFVALSRRTFDIAQYLVWPWRRSYERHRRTAQSGCRPLDAELSPKVGDGVNRKGGK